MFVSLPGTGKIEDGWTSRQTIYLDVTGGQRATERRDGNIPSVFADFSRSSAERDVQIVGNTDDEQRRAVYKALMMKKYFEKDECGVIREGTFFKDDNN